MLVSGFPRSVKIYITPLPVPLPLSVLVKGHGTTVEDLVIQPVDYPVDNYNYWGRQTYGPPIPPPPVPPLEPCSAYGTVTGFTCNPGCCSISISESRARLSLHRGVGQQGLKEDCGGSLAEPPLTCDPNKDLPGCATEAARLCQSTPGCKSFGLSPA